jgi:hypothetical protein
MCLTGLETTIEEGLDLTFLGSVPYIYHCHHYNLFHDQTLEDAVGEDRAVVIQTHAAHAAFRPLIAHAVAASGSHTPVERLQVASNVLRWMGHGQLRFDVSPEGGQARGGPLHYSHSWLEKYGAVVKRAHPADGVASGFAAAAVEIAFNLPPGAMTAVETSCVTLRDPECIIQIKPNPAATPPLPEVLRRQYLEHARPTFASQDEERIDNVAKAFKGFMRRISADERGLIQAFGVYVTAHLPTYYNLTAYTIAHEIERRDPRNRAVVGNLIREAGRICLFNTFGNILLSPEWEGLVGRLSDDPFDRLSCCCAIARGLGFGHCGWADLDPGKRLVLRAPINYEAPFYLSMYGVSKVPRCYIFQGSALGMMLLAHDNRWAGQRTLTNEMYQRLVRSGRAPWRVEETRCVARGDELCEAVVELP